MFSRANYTDQELFDQLRGGNRQVLPFLFESNIGTVREFVRKNGGSKSDADEILEDAITRLWLDIHSGNYDYKGDLHSYVVRKANDIWMQRELKEYIRSQTRTGMASRPGVYIIVLLVTGILFASAYSIFNGEINSLIGHRSNVPPAGRKKIPLLENAREEKGVESDAGKKVKTEPVKTPVAGKNIQNEKSPVGSDLPVSDSIPEQQQGEPSDLSALVSAEAVPDPLAGDPIIVKKDELLTVRNMRPADLHAMEEKELSQEVASRLNPEAGLPEESQQPRSWQVEFWKSPVNYKGYKTARNRVVLFGIEAPEMVKLYTSGNLLIMEYRQQYYLLEESPGFSSFVKLQDDDLLQKLKQL